MGRLTGGHIRIAERRKIGDYEHRECEVILAFSFEDSKDANAFETYMDGLAARIRARVQAEASGKPLPKAIDAAEVSPPKKRGRPAKVEDPPADDEPGEDATGDEEDDAPEGDDEHAPASGEVGLDDLLNDTKPTRKAKEIGNPELHEAVKATNLRIKNHKALRAYIEGFAESVNAVPQAKRAEFLKGLKSLKAAA